VEGGGTHLGEDLAKALVDRLLVELVLVEGDTLDKLLDGRVAVEGEERQAEGNVAPLARLVGRLEALAQLLHDRLGLPLL